MKLVKPLETYFPDVDRDYVREKGGQLKSVSNKIIGLNRWVNGLRSGKYTQGHYALHTVSKYGARDCCLSVYGQEVWGCTVSQLSLMTPSGLVLNGTLIANMDEDTESVLYLPRELQYILSALNDIGATYEQIAHFLESEFLEV